MWPPARLGRVDPLIAIDGRVVDGGHGGGVGHDPATEDVLAPKIRELGDGPVDGPRKDIRRRSMTPNEHLPDRDMRMEQHIPLALGNGMNVARNPCFSATDLVVSLKKVVELPGVQDPGPIHLCWAIRVLMVVLAPISRSTPLVVTDLAVHIHACASRALCWSSRKVGNPHPANGVEIVGVPSRRDDRASTPVLTWSGPCAPARRSARQQGRATVPHPHPPERRQTDGGGLQGQLDDRGRDPAPPAYPQWVEEVINVEPVAKPVPAPSSCISAWPASAPVSRADPQEVGAPIDILHPRSAANVARSSVMCVSHGGVFAWCQSSRPTAVWPWSRPPS